jgi:hypothetical protein
LKQIRSNMNKKEIIFILSQFTEYKLKGFFQMQVTNYREYVMNRN